MEVVALYRKALDKELYDLAYGNFLHPYSPEGIAQHNAMMENYDDDVDPDEEDDEDDDDYANNGTMHSKRDPSTGRFIKA